jgi:Sugar efflux transporter for intercellular exchange
VSLTVLHHLVVYRRGATCVGVLSLYYAAPLSSVGRVLSTRDSSSLHAPLCAMNAINGALWFAYGLAVKDYFVAVPNGVGASFNAACVVLCVIFPPRERKDSGDSGDAEDISSGSAGGAAAAGVEWKLLRLQSIAGGRGMRARSGFFDLSQLRWRQGGAGSMLMRMMSSSRSLRSLTSQRGAAAAAAACAPATDAAAPPEAAAAAAKGAADASDSLASSSVETADCRVRGLETSGDVAGTGTAAAKGTAVDLEAPRADGSSGNDGSGGVGH